MIRYLLAFALWIGLSAPAAFAQSQEPQPNKPKSFLAMQSCDDVGKMTAVVMNQYGEQPLFQGEGLQFLATNMQAYRSSMMYFVNQETGTWSLIGLYPDGTACMISNGRNFLPYSGPMGQ